MRSANPPELAAQDDVRARLAQQALPLLLNFTAGWCQPCKTFAPVLGAVRAKHGDRIDVVRVDVDACPELAREFGVRGVPTTILLRDGAEHDRFVGAKSEQAVVQWLVAREVALLAVQADDDRRFAFGAFYGDDSLKQFLVERLCAHMDRGEVTAHLFPAWVDGKGSVSGGLAHHGSPEVFEHVTGLPYAFACALEFLRLERRADAQALFQALAPGQDVRAAPLRLMQAWLGADALEWPAALGSAPHDALRRDWLAASGELADGAGVPAAHWTALRERARALATPDNDAYRQLEDDLAALVALMSPPPDVQDGAAWRAILGRCGFAMGRLAERADGWTREDSAKPALRERFFTQHVPIDANGEFDRELFEAKRAEWERDNADFVALEERSDSAQRSRTWIELHARFRPVLAQILLSAGP